MIKISKDQLIRLYNDTSLTTKGIADKLTEMAGQNVSQSEVSKLYGVLDMDLRARPRKDVLAVVDSTGKVLGGTGKGMEELTSNEEAENVPEQTDTNTEARNESNQEAPVPLDL